jgi:hypothetical protein
VPISTLVTLVLAAALILGGVYVARRGFVRSKGVLLAVGLLVLLVIGYLMMGGSAPD